MREASTPVVNAQEVLECTLSLGTLSPSLQGTVPGRSRERFGKLSGEWGHVSDATFPHCSWECVCKDITGGGISGQRAATPCASLPPVPGPLLQAHVWAGPRRPEPGPVWVSHASLSHTGLAVGA